MDACTASELVAAALPEFTPGAEPTDAAASGRAADEVPRSEAAGNEPAANDAAANEAARGDPLRERWDLHAPRWEYPSFTMLELRELVLRGEGGPEKFERALAQAACMRSALELSLGAIFATFTEGDRLARQGFSNLGDLTENLFGVRRRAAQVAAQLAKALRERPLLRAAAYEGLVTPSAALAVLPVAVGDDEERWVEEAKVQPVRKLKQLVKEALKERKALPGPDAAAEQAEADEEPWVRLRVPISDEDHADLRSAMALAGELVESSHRHVQLEALAQEYLSEHPGDESVAAEAERAVERRLHPLDVQTKRDAAEAKLEDETSHWEVLDPVHAVAALDVDPNALATDDELMATGLGIASELKAWDDFMGWCSAVVKGTHTHREAGFVDFRHYATERLGVPARTIETRAALEKHLWEKPELRVAKEMGLTYSKLLLLKEVPQVDLLKMAQRAEKLTVIELREAIQAKADAQMSALKFFEARVPRSVAVLLEQAFQVSLMRRVPEERPTEESAPCVDGCEHDGKHGKDKGTPKPPAEPPAEPRLDGPFLGELARHFIQAWCNERTKPKTVSQKQRAKYRRCQFPGCSRRSCQGHHIEFRSRGGSEDDWNRMPLCAYHHLVVVHEGFATITGIFPDAVEFRVNGVVWKDGQFGRRRSERV
ncbi:MAG: HNH endonuclease signature motif containing protein [Anaeromyxobacteraceae bacterium]